MPISREEAPLNGGTWIAPAQWPDGSTAVWASRGGEGTSSSDAVSNRRETVRM